MVDVTQCPDESAIVPNPLCGPSVGFPVSPWHLNQLPQLFAIRLRAGFKRYAGLHNVTEFVQYDRIKQHRRALRRIRAISQMIVLNTDRRRRPEVFIWQGFANECRQSNRRHSSQLAVTLQTEFTGEHQVNPLPDHTGDESPRLSASLVDVD